MTLPVVLGLNLSWVEPALLIEYAIFAEALGFESIWLGEHIAVPATDDWWRGPEQHKHLDFDEPQNRMPFHPNSLFLDPLIALTTVAAVTKTVRIGTGIYMLPVRHPILTARMLASLDVLSGGRLEFGVGLGWLPDEYRFLNEDWAERGRRTDEAIRCLQALFTNPNPSFAGEFYNFSPIGFEPKPVQAPLPILIGGDSKAAFRRAGTLCNGWYGPPESNARVREQLEKAGRPDEPFSYSSISVGQVGTDYFHKAAELGTGRCVVTPWEGRKVGEVGREGFAELEAYTKMIGLADKRSN